MESTWLTPGRVSSAPQPKSNREVRKMTRAEKMLVGALTVFLLAGVPSVQADEGVSVPEAPSPLKVVLSTLEGGQMGKIYYESTSPYGFKDILDGGGNDSKVTVFGLLEFPEGTEGRVPAMVFVHGSDGWLPKHERYLRELHRMGVATFRLNSFTPRGVASTVGSQIRVTEQMMISDAFHALRLLSTHPRIDPKRIGIMGASKGGAVALYTAWEPARKAADLGELKFALHLPLYPPCAEMERPDMTGAPILILAGELDQWTPAKPCVALADSLKSAGYNAEIVVYPGAYHAFDSDGSVHWVEEALNTHRCRMRILADGTVIEATNGYSLETLEKRQRALASCATRGVLSGRNNAAREQAMDDVMELVIQVFGLSATDGRQSLRMDRVEPLDSYVVAEAGWAPGLLRSR
jgi:dienelactone hydrolase